MPTNNTYDSPIVVDAAKCSHLSIPFTIEEIVLLFVNHVVISLFAQEGAPLEPL